MHAVHQLQTVAGNPDNSTPAVMGTRNSMSACMTAVFLIVAFAVAFFAPATGHAQETGTDGGVVEAIRPALEKAAREGATVIVVGSPEQSKEAAEEASGPPLTEVVHQALTRLKAVWKDAGEAGPNIEATLAKSSPDGTTTWLFLAILAGIAGIVLGRLVERPVGGWIRDVFAPRIPDIPTSRMQQIGYLLFRGLMFILLALLSALIGTLLVIIYAGDHEASRITGLAVVWTYAAFQLLKAIYINFLVPNVPEYRMINMSNEDSRHLYRFLVSGTALSLTIIGLCLWMESLGLDVNTHKLALLFGSLTAALLFCAIAIVHRESVAKAILGTGDADGKPIWLKTLSRTWHVLTIVYVMAAWGVSAVRLLLDQPASSGLVGAPLVALIAGLVVYGMALIVIDFAFDRQIQELQPADGPADSVGQPAGDGEEEAEGDAAGEPAPDADAAVEVHEPPEPIFKGLIEHASALVVTFLGIALVVLVWGVDLDDPANPITRSLDIILVAFAGYIAYRGVALWIDRKVAEEDPGDPHELPGEGPGGTGASRLATLLPIFRNFLLITIVVIAGMIVLAELGVNIGPLFAGAGVVGLAVGFGAQTLIRDIFSGAFFLMDDAFRKGEYIDIGTAKGTVEKISIRSMQLRHHNGPLNTIPFGEIKQLTNFSRDWVMMKLPLRLTYDTDVEKVRKLVKKLGIELLDHPEFGPKFLQPLKSQGVKQMDDSAMIVRVKYMTKPGDQFEIRKLVYQRIRDLFEENGIKFAHREVTVRIADDTKKLSDEEKQAVAGAVRPVIEGADQGGKPAVDTP